MVSEEEALIQKVVDLYEQISGLESLKPCKHVDTLFTELVVTCMPPTSPNFHINSLSNPLQQMRSNLIRLCGQAESLLESHFSDLLANFDYPLHHLHLFPYFSNYLKLSLLEFSILRRHCPVLPSSVAFVGSGPLPLTSIVLATRHLPSTSFHNYDLDPLANTQASKLVSVDSDLKTRMVFHTCDIMKVTEELKEYEVVFLAALVGMEKEEKLRVIEHLCEFMAEGACLMVRSAHGGRAFLYPVVEECDLVGFEVLSVFHPSDEVINSVIIARKKKKDHDDDDCLKIVGDDNHENGIENGVVVHNKQCCDHIHGFNNHGGMIEELAE
ncbi:putative nicotianamine synthase 4 [Cucurbita argyrosperma subsp. argyrosperma]|nr:putative nicotianamine synthase 4 [Cucurbita argyrosperma subsp. argyrosperma]